MIFDFEMIRFFLQELLDSRISEIRKKLKHPLTLSEKILYSHLYQQNQIRSFKGGHDYVDFAPDRVAMQDATAQMALLAVYDGRKRYNSCSCFRSLRSSYYGTSQELLKI